MQEDEVIEQCCGVLLSERSIREGFIRLTHAYMCVHARTENFFFFGQLLYTSAVAMVTQDCDPAGAQDWLDVSKGGEGRGTLLGWYSGVPGGSQTQR